MFRCIWGRNNLRSPLKSYVPAARIVLARKLGRPWPERLDFACIMAPGDSLESMDRTQEGGLIDEIVRRVVDECPRRHATSASELRAQQLVREYFDAAGLSTTLHSFTFTDNVHANLALHFGLGTLGTLVSGVAPRLAFALHAGTAASYWAESTRRAYILRKLLPFRASQNLLGVLPAEAVPNLRIVFVAHIDAAFTGLIFDPRIVKAATRERPFPMSLLHRPIAFATRAQLALALVDSIRSVVGPLALPLRPLEWLLTAPSALIFLINLEILLRNEVVPGANDDLTGVASLAVLAHRLAKDKPADVELVFVASGAEEAGLGGADALARDMCGVWQKDKTVIVVLDTLCSGDLRFIETEGEVSSLPAPPWLCRLVERVAASEERFTKVRGFVPPLGGTDAAAFLAHGWDAVGLTCIDPALGSAGHYHQASDTPDNLDLDEVLSSTDFVEILARRLIDECR